MVSSWSSLLLVSVQLSVSSTCRLTQIAATARKAAMVPTTTSTPAATRWLFIALGPLRRDRLPERPAKAVLRLLAERRLQHVAAVLLDPREHLVRRALADEHDDRGAA